MDSGDGVQLIECKGGPLDGKMIPPSGGMCRVPIAESRTLEFRGENEPIPYPDEPEVHFNYGIAVYKLERTADGKMYYVFEE